MHIETDLDEVHAKRLLALKQHLGLDDIKTVISHAIDACYEKEMGYGSHLLRVFEEEGLIGSLQGDGSLSETYKQHLDFEGKYAHRG